MEAGAPAGEEAGVLHEGLVRLASVSFQSGSFEQALQAYGEGLIARCPPGTHQAVAAAGRGVRDP